MRAFGDGTRLRILGLLARRELNVGEIARLTACSIQAVSRHLRYLYVRGVVAWEQTATCVVYRLAPAGHRLHESVLAGVLSAIDAVDEVRRDRARLSRLGTSGSRRAKGRRAPSSE
jgi:DNA-binding transcriptional ArsR family regulator